MSARNATELPPVTTCVELIALWDSPSQFATLCGAASARGKVWNRRNRIPKTYFLAVQAMCLERGWTMTETFFNQLHKAGSGHGY